MSATQWFLIGLTLGTGGMYAWHRSQMWLQGEIWKVAAQRAGTDPRRLLKAIEEITIDDIWD